MVIKWEEPPVASNRKHDHQAVADALRGRPGEWGLAFENVPSSLALHIRRGSYKAYKPAGSFDAKSVGIDRSTSRAEAIYVRFVGGEA